MKIINIDIENSTTAELKKGEIIKKPQQINPRNQDNAEATCISKESRIFPLEGNCLVRNIIYLVTFKTATSKSSYVIMIGNIFRTTYYNLEIIKTMVIFSAISPEST